MEGKDLQIRILDVEGIGYLRQGKYEKAEKIFRKQYELLLEVQEEKGVRLHKGGPLHNWGLSLLFQGKTDDALRRLIFALVEDLISSEKKTDTDPAPASRVLRGVCGAIWGDLEPVETVVLREKTKGPIMRPQDIETYIQGPIGSIQSNYQVHLKYAWQLEIEGQKAIEQREFERAEKAYASWLDQLYAYQEKRGVRIHKEYVLFNMGFVLYQQNKISEAVYYFLESYIEDIISARVPEHIKETNSFKGLSQLGFGSKILGDLQSWVIQKKDRKEDISRPEKLCKSFLEERGISLPEVSLKKAKIEAPETTAPKKKSVDELPGTYSDRVFIGGAYREGLLDQKLRKIEQYVRELGYEPVIAIDYDPPRDPDGSQLLNVHDFDIVLIHTCRYVIFELSIAAGQYNEVEWSIRFLRKPTWGVCEAGKQSEISTLIRDLFVEVGKDIFYYSSSSSLRDYIRSILSERSP